MSAPAEPSQSMSRFRPDVSIIIVNWNSKEHVRRCLTSLFEYTKSFSWEILVIDNASFDGCEEMLAREFPACVFIQSPDNLGFGRANNLAAGHAHGHLFLNPDTELLENSIPILRESLEGRQMPASRDAAS